MVFRSQQTSLVGQFAFFFPAGKQAVAQAERRLYGYAQGLVDEFMQHLPHGTQPDRLLVNAEQYCRQAEQEQGRAQ